jgi:hypothetical protein
MAFSSDRLIAYSAAEVSNVAATRFSTEQRPMAQFGVFLEHRYFKLLALRPCQSL